MKKITLKIVGGLTAALLGSSLTLACNDAVDPDGAGGEDGSEDNDTGGSTNGSGGSESTGGSDSGTGGDENVGGLGGGENGSGGEPQVEPGVPSLVRSASFIIENALNANASAIGSDGKIYIAGATDTSAVGVAQAVGNLRLAVWRFNADGSADTNFGVAGKLESTIADPGTAYDILEWSPGRFAIVLSGGVNGVALVQLDASGAAATLGAPSTVAFGWESLAELNAALTTKSAAITAVCSAVGAGTAKTECDEALVTAALGVCNPTGVNYAADLCVTAQAECATATATCQAAYPLAAAPNFNQRPSAYSSWGAAVDKSGAEPKLVVFAAGPPAEVETGTQRWDADRWVTRVLAADFSFDTSFNGGAPYGHDVSGLKLSDGGRRGLVSEDGSIVSAGYTSIPGKGNHSALIRLLPSGAVDSDFGFSDDETVPFTPGQTHMNPFRDAGDKVGDGFAESYGITELSDGSYVTSGYGNSFWAVKPASVDLVSMRVKADGKGLFNGYGGKLVGSVTQFAGAVGIQSEADGVFVTGQDRGRDVIALSDDRTVHAGLFDERSTLIVLNANGSLNGLFDYGFEQNFFSVNLNAAGDRLVASTAARAKVNAPVSPAVAVYAKMLVALVDFSVVEE